MIQISLNLIAFGQLANLRVRIVDIKYHFFNWFRYSCDRLSPPL